MKKFKIFVSSAQKELKQERRAVKDFITNNFLFRDYFEVFLFEDAPAKGKSSEISYLKEVRGCDIYIGLLGYKYGETRKGKPSPTETEFREAVKQNKEILIFIKGDNSQNDRIREAGVQKLIKEIKDPKKGYSYKRFNDTSDLTNFVFESLVDFLQGEGIIGRGDFDQRICERAKFSDIDSSKVQWFLRTAKEARKFRLDSKLAVKDVLTHLDLLRDGKLTNAAVLLFGKNPHRFHLQAEVKCLHLPGTEVHKPFLSYKVYSDNLFEQVDKAVAFVLDIIKQAVIQQRHTPQFKRPFEIPVFAIQEAIVNAVVHRNYNATSGVQVMVFADRVEVWNSGSLPADLSVEDLKKPHTSHPANPLLANVFYLADYIQRAGSGTLEMIKQCRAQGAPEPEFVLKRNVEFRTILPRDVFTESFFQKMGLNDRQVRAIKFVKEKGSVKLADLQNVFKETTRKTLYRDLQSLVDKHILKAYGGTKGRKYSL